MSAIPPKADIDPSASDVRFGPQADIREVVIAVLTRGQRGVRIGRSHGGTGDIITSVIGCMRSMTGPV